MKFLGLSDKIKKKKVIFSPLTRACETDNNDDKLNGTDIYLSNVIDCERYSSL